MHKVIQDGLEGYLSGQIRRDFQAHLDSCSDCRQEVEPFRALSNLVASLNVAHPEQSTQEDAAGFAAAPLVEPGFYARLSQRISIEAEARQRNSVWSIFSFDPAFVRRMAFASLMTLALLGGFLISRETDYNPQFPRPDATAIMAEHDGSIPHDPGADRDRMMVTLATYQQ